MLDKLTNLPEEFIMEFPFGTKIEVTYTVKDEDGVAVDFTGATNRMLVKELLADLDAAAITEFTVDATQQASGIFTITLDTAASASLTAGGTYYADHRITDADAEDWVVFRARLIDTAIATRATSCFEPRPDGLDFGGNDDAD